MVEAAGSSKSKKGASTKKGTGKKSTKKGTGTKKTTSATDKADQEVADVGSAAAAAQEMLQGKKEVKPSEFTWTTATLPQLVKEIERVRDEGKYLIIWDKNGNVEMFFKYKGHLNDWAPRQLKATIDGGDKSGVLEKVRKDIVYTMRSGEKMLIDFDKLSPNLKEEWLDDEVFNANRVFDRENWFIKDNYLKYVK